MQMCESIWPRPIIYHSKKEKLRNKLKTVILFTISKGKNHVVKWFQFPGQPGQVNDRTFTV